MPSLNNPAIPKAMGAAPVKKDKSTGYVGSKFVGAPSGKAAAPGQIKKAAPTILDKMAPKPRMPMKNPISSLVPPMMGNVPPPMAGTLPAPGTIPPMQKPGMPPMMSPGLRPMPLPAMGGQAPPMAIQGGMNSIAANLAQNQNQNPIMGGTPGGPGGLGDYLRNKMMQDKQMGQAGQGQVNPLMEQQSQPFRPQVMPQRML